MGKRVDVPNGQLQGLTAYPSLKRADIENIGVYAQAALEGFVRDILNRGGSPVVAGGDMILTGGVNFTINSPLAVRTNDGTTYDQIDPTPQPFTLAPADPVNPRIDLVYATFQGDVPSAAQLRHVKVDPSTPGSAEGDVNLSTEVWDQIQLGVVTGVAAASPNVP
ncbi:MAG: hypothetical protein ACREAC_30625, partial [Blastocatellia bacterium]